jgi:phosphatidylserine/phosphatidylglycerophosphate/cardiolipin synthase-like enzyme
VVTQSHRVVKELLRLFDADANRGTYVTRARDLVVSPENSRRRLETFIRKARKRIDIYDPQVSDDAMLALLTRKVAQGVVVRILGELERKWAESGIDARAYPTGRLHVRAMIRDGRRAFVGSQSLRKLELDGRREVGIIVRDPGTVRRMKKTFDRDWKNTKQPSTKTSGRGKKKRGASA